MFEELDDVRFSPSMGLDLFFKPLYFIHKQKISARDAANFGEMMKRLQGIDWQALEELLQECAVRGERDYIKFESLRHDKHMVAKKIIAPYVMHLAEITELSAKLRAHVVAAVYYCLFRWLEHDFKVQKAPTNKSHGESKYDYIKQLAKSIESALLQSNLSPQLFSSEAVLGPWVYRENKKAPEYREAKKIQAFVESHGTFEKAWNAILA